MIKNIAVIDEQGNKYEATYPKRAKGLVKSGRARFVDEWTICLARPPVKSEDKTMSENMVSKNYGSEDLNAEKANSEGASAEVLDKSETLSGLEALSESLSGLEALSSTEELKKKIAAYLDAARPKPAEGQENQPQEKTLGREIVEQVLDQLDHFATDDAYIATLAEKHVDSEDMTNIVRMRETTRQKQLEVYKTVLETAIQNEAYAQPNALRQVEQVADWMKELDRDDFDTDMWEIVQAKAAELMYSITVS